jgi:hypothetical protein
MTTAHAFCKIQSTLKIMRLRRGVASEKRVGLLQSVHFVYQRISPAAGVPGPSDSAQRRIKPGELRANSANR